MNCHCFTTRSSHGFSLVEMMVAIAVLAILVAIAAPQMQNQITGNQVTAATNDLLGSLAQARSDAIRFNQQQSVAPNTLLADRLGDVTLAASDGNLLAGVTFNNNGTTNDAGTITISNTSRTRTIRILGSGKAYLE